MRLLRTIPSISMLLLATSLCSCGDSNGPDGGGPDAGGSDAGRSWSVIHDGLDRVLLSAWGVDATDLWVAGGSLGSAGGPLALHLEGGAWTELDTGVSESFWWVWGTGEGEVFFVGEGGVIVRTDGVSVERMTSPTTATLFGAWGSSPTDVWAVGGDPFGTTDAATILHFDGTEWTETILASPLSGALFKVWGTGSDDVWAVGQVGIALHWDGVQWTPTDTGVTGSLFTVHAVAPDDVWAVGGPPRALIHWDGTSWTAEDPFGYGGQLNGVAATVDEVLVVGVGGIKWRREAGAWIDDYDFDPVGDLHGAWLGTDGQAFVVGGNFLHPPGTTRYGVVGYYGSTPPASTLR